MNSLHNPPTDPARVVLVIQMHDDAVVAATFKYKKGKWHGCSSGESYTLEDLVFPGAKAGWIDSPLQPSYVAPVQSAEYKQVEGMLDAEGAADHLVFHATNIAGAIKRKDNAAFGPRVTSMNALLLLLNQYVAQDTPEYCAQSLLAVKPNDSQG